MSLIGISSLMNRVTSDDNPTVNSSVTVITVQVINEVCKQFLQSR